MKLDEQPNDLARYFSLAADATPDRGFSAGVSRQIKRIRRRRKISLAVTWASATGVLAWAAPESAWQNIQQLLVNEPAMLAALLGVIAVSLPILLVSEEI